MDVNARAGGDERLDSMNSVTLTAPSYDFDFYGWTQQQADLIRAGELARLDLDNILEEIESMGRSEQRGLGNRLEVLLAHLLKWKYQPDFRGGSWQFTIEEQRRRIARLLKKNPSLKSELPETLEEAYDDAIRFAAKETGLARSTFPAQCPWAFEEFMDDGFWPD